MKASELRARYRKIVIFFAHAAANIFFWDIFLSRLGLRPLARKTRSKRLHKLTVQFRALAIEMGGVMIKVGQFLSSRQDVLPAEIIKELAGLQDEVPPEDFADIREKAERELGGSLEELMALIRGLGYEVFDCDNNRVLEIDTNEYILVPRPAN